MSKQKTKKVAECLSTLTGYTRSLYKEKTVLNFNARPNLTFPKTFDLLATNSKLSLSRIA